ncbi:putative leader peptide [Streptomyces brevispora]
MHLPPCGTVLTAPTTHRQSDVMPPVLLLYGRVHVDLVRYASARCPDA